MWLYREAFIILHFIFGIFMRILIAFCLLFCLQGWSGEFENSFKNLHLTPKAQEMLKSAMAEFYTQKLVYQRNSYHIRNKLLLDLKNQTKVDLGQYKQALKEVSDKYIEARIAFYSTIAEILEAEDMEKFLEKFGSN